MRLITNDDDMKPVREYVLNQYYTPTAPRAKLAQYRSNKQKEIILSKLARLRFSYLHIPTVVKTAKETVKLLNLL